MRQAMDDNPEHGVARLLELTDNLEHGVTRLLELIRWLALPYDNEPVFASTNWDGSPIESGERLQATWRAVMGEKAQVTAGSWAQCPTCAHWELQAVLIDPCAACDHGSNDHQLNRDQLCSGGAGSCACTAYQPVDVLETGT